MLKNLEKRNPDVAYLIIVYADILIDFLILEVVARNDVVNGTMMMHLLFAILRNILYIGSIEI